MPKQQFALVTVNDLRRALNDLPGTAKVVLSTDEEGNGHNYMLRRIGSAGVPGKVEGIESHTAVNGTAVIVLYPYGPECELELNETSLDDLVSNLGEPHLTESEYDA